MKTTLLFGLAGILTLISGQAAITATVDPTAKTITFQGTAERLQDNFRDIRWGTIGAGDHFATQQPPSALDVIGKPNDQRGILILSFSNAGALTQVILEDWDHQNFPGTIPITANPLAPVSYAAIPGAADFESSLALGDLILQPIPSSGALEPLTFKLKACAVPEPGYGLALLGLLGCSTMWRRKRS